MSLPESAICALATILKSHYAPTFLEKLRNYWRAAHDKALVTIAHRKNEEPHRLWTDADVIEWCSLLQIPPYQHMYEVRDAKAGCPKSEGLAASIYTRWTGHDRSLMMCRCGERWLVLY